MTDWKGLRARCKRRVDQLERDGLIPDPWDINTFLDRLEAHRHRAIDLCAVRWIPGQSTGALRAYHDFDAIAYAANTSALHQDAIILHEVGHLLAEHRGRCVLSATEARRRAPDLTHAALAHLLDRVHLSEEEHEAEITARLVIARIAGQRARRPRRHPDDLADRVEAAFG